ncbi:hypothetical protein M378DRAFT_15850 [Amanita muscaria Koide BX008]|uniref:Uncharacterized protein n=1 Tax=Amanita muscaria (strain Koide BX008) TaxID=946122 RepID=A0A0C2WMW4_AMAMK|nr:hypothetical protein M378DRAFT_15850 [Amanita muscaria Koide BX008]
MRLDGGAAGSSDIAIFDHLYGNLTGHETLALNVVLHYLLKHRKAIAFEVDDVYNVLEEDTNDSDDESSSSRIHFIVINAITPLLGPNLSAASSQGHVIIVHLK